ncbi:uncharacterized protein DNG_05493 [Cephalotrichum gorgonifer]|uniref:Uncharacterized protein n=1 Tax=Cephalotrichum gorgonifer TaxID=2041049 RepID=A0AAE8SVK8_9PEZI|nr:uncharacterized protein DNG_05493 [Cephalotrichum gorgonifer]
MADKPSYFYAPLSAPVVHVLLAACLISAVVRSLRRSYLQLTPAARETISRYYSRRGRLVALFAALALAGLLQAAYAGVTYLVLSYKVWAGEHGVDLPERYAHLHLFWGENGVFAFSLARNPMLDNVARWLGDVPIYADAWEIGAERVKRQWWGRQLDLGVLPWTLLLAIEGRGRRVPFTWAYLGLAHLVGLSFGQNLFYLALLLTPRPVVAIANDGLPASRRAAIRDAISPPKPLNWCPHPGLFLISYAFSALSLCFPLPLVVTLSLARQVLLTRALTFVPLLLPMVVPKSWGTVHHHPHHARSSFTALFQVISAASLVLHGSISLRSLLSGSVLDHDHRHSGVMLVDTERRDAWDRTTLGFGKILSAGHGHPVVAGASRDVLLSALSLGLWAAVRAIDARDVLRSSVPFYNGSLSPASRPRAPPPETTDARALLAEELRAESEATAPARDQSYEPRPARRRGRPRKTGAVGEVKVDLEEPANEQPLHVGEEDGAVEWESAALAWGIAAAGGLGSAAAGVFGGECVSW